MGAREAGRTGTHRTVSDGLARYSMVGQGGSIYQRKRFSTWSGQQGAQPGSGESTIPWHGVVLLAISAIALVVMTGLLFGSMPYRPGITPDIVYFILVSRLIALGCVSFTVVVVNKVFYLKR